MDYCNLIVVLTQTTCYTVAIFNFHLGSLESYSAHVHDVDVQMSKESIKAVGKIAMRLPQASEYCIDALLSFISWEIEYITSQTLVVTRGKKTSSKW